MNELGRYLATYYLPHLEPLLIQKYEEVARLPASAERLARMHIHMWRMALTDESYDLDRVRMTLTRWNVTPRELEAMDDVVVRRLTSLIASHGGESKNALHVEVAMALAAVNMTGAMSTAA